MAANGQPSILMTAFEPSGDAHAAPIVSELRARFPDVEIVAWGGKRMAAAGARLMGTTAQDGVMGLGGLSRIRMFLDVKRAIRTYLAGLGSREVLHIGVDSPSANIRIAPVVRAIGGSSVQFVAPQYWAWAPWRIRRFRRYISEVLCILPFEPEWFQRHGVEAHFVGHPVLGEPMDDAAIAASRGRLNPPDGDPKIVILPGSRRSEVRANMALLLRTFAGVQERHPGARAVVLAASEELMPLMKEHAGGVWPASVTLASGELFGALDWADLALCASGTVSMDLARQSVPMVAVYNVSLLTFAFGKVLLNSDHCLLPNIIANQRIVPEFVPWRDDEKPVIAAANALLDDPAAMEKTRVALRSVIAKFGQHEPAREAVNHLARWIEPRLND